MIKDPIQQAMNDQIQAELYSSYLYLQMAAWLESKNLKGMSHWMRVQAMEEQVHAMKFYLHILERGGDVQLQAIEQPKIAWNSPLELFEAALKHEEYISDRINKLMDISMQESDYASRGILEWFVDEQVEEEANAGENVENLKLINEQPGGILYIDERMSQRVFTPPAGFSFLGSEGGA
jgi:ferritin